MKTKIPLKLTLAEAREISNSLELIPRLTESLKAASETIEYLTKMAYPDRDRVVQGFGQR